LLLMLTGNAMIWWGGGRGRESIIRDY
jgi:hypothetical protein